MHDDRAHTESPKRHRLARGAALSVVVMTLCAPLAGAAGVQVPPVPQMPLPVEEPATPGVPTIPSVPEAPGVPDLPGVEVPPIVPDVTTLPVPVEPLDDVVEPVLEEVTDPVEDVVEDTTGTVDEVTDPVGDVVDEVTDPEGPVGGVVDEVTDPEGPVGGVVDEVTDPEGPVGGVVDEVTDPDGPVGGVVDGVKDATGNVGDTATGVVDKVGTVVDGVTGSLPPAPVLPGGQAPGPGGSDPGVLAGGDVDARVADAVEDAEALAGRIAATVPADGFAATVLAAAEAADLAAPPRRDASAPSLIERIAQSLSDVAQKIAFPLLLAAAVGAFVVMQNRMDRKDPKLALAALDADEDLLGFE